MSDVSVSIPLCACRLKLLLTSKIPFYSEREFSKKEVAQDCL